MVRSIGNPQNPLATGLSTTALRSTVTAVDIGDLTAASEGLELFQQYAMSLQSAPLRARRVFVQFQSVVVVYHRTNLRVCARTRVAGDRLAYVTFGSRSRGAVEGLRVRRGMMITAGPGAEVSFVVEPAYESITLFVRPDVLCAHLPVRELQDGFRLPRGVEVVRAEPARARELFRLGKRLVAAASNDPEIFGAGRPERAAAEAELIGTLLAAARTTTAIEPRGAERTRLAHSQIVEIAERHILSHIGERVHVPDLCRVADVSERTLQGAFQEIMGMTPVAYLTRLRLHRARAELLAAEPGSIRVSDTAAEWGFWHFGEFSSAYRRCFGEPPSVTLRRTPLPLESR
jgi:AraC-like DNA-binding protein